MRLGGWLPLVVFAQACAGDMGDEVGGVRAGLEAITWTELVGVTATGNDLVKSSTEGNWLAGGSSVEALSGDGYVEFTTGESASNKMAGLTNGDFGPHYADIGFALHLNAGGVVAVRESGVLRAAAVGPYAAGDIFRVQVVDDVVTYWRNGGLLYTSSEVPSFPLVLDSSLRTTGATINDAMIETAPFWQAAVGASADGNDLTRTAGGPGWIAGASSIEALTSDGQVEFTTGENNTAKMAGLASGDGGTSYQDIDFAIYLRADGTVAVREGGASRGNFGPYAAGDLFRIAVADGVVTYARNGVVFYTSGAAATLPLLLDTSLHSAGATIENARFDSPVVVFDNSDGIFVWEPECRCVEFEEGVYLNLTRPADQQSGDPHRAGILFVLQDSSVGNITRGYFLFRGNSAGLGLMVARDEPFVIPGEFEETTITVVGPLGKNVGDVVGPADDWGWVTTAHMQDLSGEYGPSQIWFTDGIIGVRFQRPDGIHYGFIELDYAGGWSGNYRPIRWGYNSIPNEPLVIPP